MVFTSAFPKYRAFMMLVSLAMLVAIYGADAHAHRHGDPGGADPPDMVEALGHNVPRVFMMVFGGGAALAGLAGVIGGNAFVTEPSMAAAVGSIVFVVAVVGGMGSLVGAFIASILIGLLQTFAVTLDGSLAGLFASFGVEVTSSTPFYSLWKLTVSQVAPVLPMYCWC